MAFSMSQLQQGDAWQRIHCRQYDRAGKRHETDEWLRFELIFVVSTEDFGLSFGAIVGQGHWKILADLQPSGCLRQIFVLAGQGTK
jgi:hypothetical protein